MAQSNARKPGESLREYFNRQEAAEVIRNRKPRPCGYCGAQAGYSDPGDGWDACAACGGI